MQNNFYQSPHGLWCRYGVYSFFIFGVLGIVLPFTPIWLENQGVSLGLIGVIIACGQLTRAMIDPVLGSLNDYMGRPKYLLVLVPIVMIFLLLMIFLSNALWFMIICYIMFVGIMFAVQSLGDNMSIHILAIRNWSYGPLRSMGSLGFVVVSSMAAYLLPREGLGDEFIYVLIIIAALTLFFSLLLPNIQVSKAESKKIHKDYFKPIFIIFLLVVFLSWHSHALTLVVGSIYWSNILEFSKPQIAMLWNMAVFGEILMFFVARRILCKIHPFYGLLLAVIAGMIRWIIFALATNFITIFLASSLHGFSFALLHTSAIVWISGYYAPKGYISSGISLMGASVGIATATGSLYAGYLYAYLGHYAWLVDAFYCAIAAILVLVLLRNKKTINDYKVKELS